VKYDRDTHSWKTHRCLWEEDLPWSSVTLPKWGSLHDGGLSERTTPEHLTSGIEFGSSLKEQGAWPTPKAWDGEMGCPRTSGRDIDHVTHLGTAVRYWPTPRASEYKGTGPVGSKSHTHMDGKGYLCAVVATAEHSFPTPGTTGMSNGTGNCEKANKLYESGVINEEERRSMRAGNGGQLNPDWVEWLMGWPIGWTDIEPMEELLWLDWSEDPADEDYIESYPTPCTQDYRCRGPNSSQQGLPDIIKRKSTHGGRIPRVTKSKTNRTPRLKAIGNGQVPAVAALAWRILSDEIDDKEQE